MVMPVKNKGILIIIFGIYALHKLVTLTTRFAQESAFIKDYFLLIYNKTESNVC